MPTSTTNAISGPLTTNGITTIFPFTFTAPSTAEVQVLSRDIATGALTIVDPADYTVGLTIGGGGTVTFAVAPATGAELYPKLNPLFTQDIEFADGAKITSSALHRIADRAAARDQFLLHQLSLALKVNEGDEPISGSELISLASIVNALNGPLYSSTVAGLASTADGQEFTVDNADKTATVYRNNGGTAVLVREVILDPTADAAASKIGTDTGETLQEVIDDFRSRLTALEP
jgi:hypothetical protein